MMASKFANFILELNYEDIDKETLEKTKLCFLDYLAVTLRGMKEESTKIAIKTLNQLFSAYHYNNAFKSSFIDGTYTNPLNAGFINGIAAHSLDLDDGHRFAGLHLGSVIFSTAIAISQAENNTGNEFFEAVIGGYEVAIVLGTLINPNHRNQGFHSTGTIGTIASCVTAAKLLKLDYNQIIATLSTATTSASGLLESDHKGTMGKPFHVGNAVYNGILAAFLAKNGFTGTESIIDGDEGFIKGLATKTFNELDQKLKNSYLDQELGKFHINNVYLKKYPVCRHLHSSIESILNLRESLIRKYIDKYTKYIDKIDIYTYKIASQHNNHNISNKEGLKQSLPYSAALALLFGKLDINVLDNFSKDDVKSIADKINIHCDSELESFAPDLMSSKVIITTSTGHVFENLTDIPQGETGKPFSKKDILDKFNEINQDIDLIKIIAIENKIDNLDKLKINDFMEFFHELLRLN
ncbi:MmgE/PrpD family protein [Methanobrevibacter filiformis]|uniref:2-methylcitrate dehydratase n=1 Tax=Methanobrevibacter filiformis TaxID=55758 RepID=A0A166C845_9EURY|nr:MmgE/PrpD family protein [Methanobrevibacter filiformis]KZX12097.1 2-methylcitrate dehydratase [Methanobrevibacter filiformis]